MRTIGRKRSSASPSGDVTGLCTYCGAKWYRSQLVRDGAGALACPDDAAGLDTVSASLGNAQGARTRKMGRQRFEIDCTFEAPNTVPSPGFIDPNGPPKIPPT